MSISNLTWSLVFALAGLVFVTSMGVGQAAKPRAIDAAADRYVSELRSAQLRAHRTGDYIPVELGDVPHAGVTLGRDLGTVSGMLAPAPLSGYTETSGTITWDYRGWPDKPYVVILAEGYELRYIYVSAEYGIVITRPTLDDKGGAK